MLETDPTKDKPEQWSAARIYQTLCALKILQCRQEDNTELVAKLRQQIGMWGGVAEIDNWMTQHDPYHGRPSTIEGLNWDWLNEPTEPEIK